MAKVIMKPFFALGFLKDKSKVLENLQKLNCVELTSELGNSEINFDSDLKIKKLSDSVAEVEKAIDVLKSRCKVRKNLFNCKRVEPLNRLNQIELNHKFLLEQVDLVNELDGKINKNLKKIDFLQSEKDKLSWFLNFDSVLTNFETKFTKCFLCEAPQKIDVKKLNTIFYGSGAYFEVVCCNKFKTIVFVVVLKENYVSLKQKLLNLKFSLVKLNLQNVTARQRFDWCLEEIAHLDLQNANYLAKLNEKLKFLYDFELLFDYFNLKLERVTKFVSLNGTLHTFFLEGFLNPKKESEFIKLVNKFNLFYEISAPDADSPVDFQNCGIVAAVEEVTKTYSMPAVFDVDPNPFMAFFYYVFFGIMFSDAGYGAVMAIFCSFFAFSKKIDLKSKNKFAMFFYCGVSTTFWGLMFGSFFGDSVGVFSKKFLGTSFLMPPLFIDALNEPMKLLFFSLFLGFLQIFVGILIKFFALIKSRNFKEAFFVEFGWVNLMFGSGIVLTASLFNLAFLKFVGFVFICVGVVFVVLLSGYKSKGVMKFFSGIINLYGVTSYVGDVLSYCRLMALAIATGVVASVVNLLSTMLCGSFFGFLAFVLVFVFGHAMNFGINALGAYVHTVRLQYVEFFSKFYDGGGRLFNLFGLNRTKFVDFVDVDKIDVK